MKRFYFYLKVAFSLIFVFTSLTTVVNAAPRFYCQAAGDYEGGYWGEGVPNDTLRKIKSKGCAISCAAMALYPKSAKIFDERAGDSGVTKYSRADPYVAYRANGDSYNANWNTIANKFDNALPKIESLSNKEDYYIAAVLDDYLDDGSYPIANIPGHFIIFTKSNVHGHPGTESIHSQNIYNKLSNDETVSEDEIEPLTDEELNKIPKNNKYSVSSNSYDKYFHIHDPGMKNGKNINFTDNLKDAELEDISRIVVY
ncbi:conserved exported protein of unknown function [Tepidanaerobacter acetatoxydans Re1]|uniref:Peptidase C39-like domain-containing protein n=1 Tax=Tepidanaerobacter acetatoxydans (strain DSM 21804 / JCM 16047 / Re1) TaxID=1209989 RepID=F4LX19_TEPAE|nr:hypothetical protein [Tepidanaerobacter acetatoxydans]AEE90997.1 hypothetical protein TepRe1_0816 [Tepidanaerobacter acetatoxydans Re1]CCP25602.1 conserved exported protein of unknown function [Tepidanaerobacter acetatoxydans Re1]